MIPILLQMMVMFFSVRNPPYSLNPNVLTVSSLGNIKLIRRMVKDVSSKFTMLKFVKNVAIKKIEFFNPQQQIRFVLISKQKAVILKNFMQI